MELASRPRNQATATARDFHAATSYRPAIEPPPAEHIVMGAPPHAESAFWRADPSIEPLPYKMYETLPRIDLPRTFEPSATSALEALCAPRLDATSATPDLRSLARLGLFSNGLLNRSGPLANGRVVEFRTAGATGARYHLELYFACGDLPDLAAGVYHYAADQHSLRPLRLGDYRQALVAASGAEPALASAPVIAAFTSTFWRNAYTYKARAYRHAFWDCGTTLANLVGVATSVQLPTRIVLGFADQPVNHLLGVDGERESSIALVALGRSQQVAPAADHVPAIDHSVRPISAREVVFPWITDMHAASMLASSTEAASWRAQPLQRGVSGPSGQVLDLHPMVFEDPSAARGPFGSPEDLPRTRIEDVILARRSTRHYDTATPLSYAALSILLRLSARPLSFDCLDPAAPPLHDEYLIVNSVDALPPGAYVHHIERGQLELLRQSDMRGAATHLAVEQSYAGEAHVNIYYLADLEPILARYGNRGYRLAQLEAALYAGRLNLAAHALGLGGVGSTSYDDEVVRFFSPHAAGKAYLFVTVLGNRRRAPDALGHR